MPFSISALHGYQSPETLITYLEFIVNKVRPSQGRGEGSQRAY